MTKFLLQLALLISFALISERGIASESGSSQVVLITGASRGIGLATATHLAESGYRVYAGIRKNNASALPSHQNLRFIALDVTDPSTIRHAVAKILKKEGRIDVLINNAGYALGGPVECLAMKEIEAQMDVNFLGVIRMCQAVLPQMRKQQSGHILNISSVQGVYGQPYGSLYTASKAAMESLSEALSIEVSPWNIALSIVEPGYVETNFTIKLGSRKVEHNPYRKICAFLAHISEGKRDVPEFGQTAEEVAQVLKKVIEDPHPRLRYQTSADSERTVSSYITDVSGAQYTQRMKADLDIWLSHL